VDTQDPEVPVHPASTYWRSVPLAEPAPGRG
jgi:hypothetical protein